MSKFLYAIKGLLVGFKHHSITIQFILALLAVIAGFVFKIKADEWLIFIILIGLVISSEIFNTCIEGLCDLIDKNHNLEIARIKDMAAGAVLINCISAAIIAIIIIIF